jgi:hypothetical protein
MVVQNRQRITRAISAAILSLAVHLPQLVWRTPFETLQGRRVRIFFPYQAPPLQDPVNGDHHQRLAFFPQQNFQFLRAPTVFPPQLDDTFLVSRRRL